MSATTNGGNAELKKYSLGIVSYVEGNSPHTDFAVRQVQTDGSAGSVKFDGQFAGSYGSGHGNSGREAAVSSLRSANGKAVLWVDYRHDMSTGRLNVYPQAAFITSNDSQLSISGDVIIELSTVAETYRADLSTYMQSVQGGIFFPNDNKEYFAISFTKNTQIGHKQSTPYCTAVIFIIGMSLEDDKITLTDTGIVIEQSLRQEYSPASIAVGDFTGTGTTNEIALTTADNNGIYLSVFRLTNNNGTYSYTSALTKETVCTYTGAMKDGYVSSYAKFANSEVLAGDFDGDGKTEIAVVYKDDADAQANANAFGRINVSIYKWSNGSFRKESANTSYNNTKSETPLSGGFSQSYVYILGLKAAKGDFDGDGKDEIAVLLLAVRDFNSYYSTGGMLATSTRVFSTNIYPYIARWYCDTGTITPKYDSKSLRGKGITEGALNSSSGNALFGTSNGTFYYWEETTSSLTTNTKTSGVSLDQTFNYVQRTFAIKAAPLTGNTGKAKIVDDIAISWSGNSDREAGEGANQYVYVLPTNLSGGEFSSFGESKEVFRGTQKLTKVAIVPADYIGEGIELDSPAHIKILGTRTYAAILQTTPYHVDYIPVPYETDQTLKLTNFTYSTGLNTSYTHDSSTSTGNDVKFNTKSSAEVIEELKMDKKKTEIFRKAAAFAIEKAGGKDADKILDGLVDKVDTVQKETDKTAITTVLTDKMQTSTSDRVAYYVTDIHMWRYPIKDPAPSWLFRNLIEGDASTSKRDKYLTFMIADDPVFHVTAGVEDDLYQPLHEEGNLFSYPTNIAQIPGYANRQLTLTGQSSITYSPGSHTRTLTITQDASQKTTDTKEVKYGKISKTISRVKYLTGKASSQIPAERANTSVFRKSYSSTDTLTASFPNPEGDYANVTFTTDMQAYADEAGILTLGFAVNSFGSTAELWRNSVYNKKPDPALYLPGKYYFKGNEVIARTNEKVATKIRGVRFYVPETSEYTGSMLYNGEKYRIDVPVYNASFVAVTTPFDVVLSYRTKGETAKTEIGRKQITIGGW